MTTVELLEDNAGSVYIVRDDEKRMWCLGQVTRDMHGQFTRDINAWLRHAWMPDIDGASSEVPNDWAHLDHVASYNPDGGLLAYRRPDQNPCAWLYISGEQR